MVLELDECTGDSEEEAYVCRPVTPVMGFGERVTCRPVWKLIAQKAVEIISLQGACSLSIGFFAGMFMNQARAIS